MRTVVDSEERWIVRMQGSWRWTLAYGILWLLMAASSMSRPPGGLPPVVDAGGTVMLFLAAAASLVRAGYLLHATADGPAARKWLK